MRINPISHRQGFLLVKLLLMPDIAACAWWAAARMYAKQVNFVAGRLATCAALRTRLESVRLSQRCARENIAPYAAVTEKPIAMNVWPIRTV